MSPDTKTATPDRNGKGSGKDRNTMKFKGKRPEKKQNEPAGRIGESSSVVFRAPGVTVTKYSRISYPQATVVSVKYSVVFDGHATLDFPRMGEAVERAKQPAPEKSVEAVATVETAGSPNKETVVDEAEVLHSSKEVLDV